MKVGKTIRNVFIATMRGELLLSLHIDKYLPHIVWFFVVACLAIFASLKIDSTMVRREKNRAEIEVLRIERDHLMLDLARFDKVTALEEKLEEMGSDVTAPKKPARKIRR